MIDNSNDNKLTIEQLRKKYRSEGYYSLTNSEKIRLLLSYSEKDENIDKIAENVIEIYGNIHTAADSSSLFLMNVCEMSMSSAVLLNIIPAISNKRTFSKYSKIKLNSSENAKKLFSALLKNSSIEKSIIVATNSRFNIINQFIIFQGESDKVDMPLSKIYKFAQCKGNYIFIAHCHPNGSAIPSQNDINTTIKIKDNLNLINTPLVDHIIVGSDCTLSMREYLGGKVLDDIKKYKTNVTTDE